MSIDTKLNTISSQLDEYYNRRQKATNSASNMQSSIYGQADDLKFVSKLNKFTYRKLIQNQHNNITPTSSLIQNQQLTMIKANRTNQSSLYNTRGKSSIQEKYKTTSLTQLHQMSNQLKLSHPSKTDTQTTDNILSKSRTLTIEDLRNMQ